MSEKSRCGSGFFFSLNHSEKVLAGLNNGNECGPKSTQTPTCCVVYMVKCLQTKLFDLASLGLKRVVEHLACLEACTSSTIHMLLSFCKA